MKLLFFISFLAAFILLVAAVTEKDGTSKTADLSKASDAAVSGGGVAVGAAGADGEKTNEKKEHKKKNKNRKNRKGKRKGKKGQKGKRGNKKAKKTGDSAAKSEVKNE